MPTSERSLTLQEHALFKNYAATGFDMISDVPCSRMDVIVAGIDAYIQKRQGPLLFASTKGFDGDDADAGRALGTVWGNQVVREFGWEWICMTLGEAEHFVVASPDRALVVFAHEYVWKCLESNDIECSVALSFDLMRAGAIKAPPALTYTSMMSKVKREEPRQRQPNRLLGFIKKAGSRAPHKQWNESCRDCAHV
ncbi:hypothetical protein [Variovorax sp. dw_308]|uniref:hypothetical protein n=1 Tax=Variovorax sp. dw_308 TaxID=2721546 RepID=UPI001C492695|nr:hypothetical protein [Variovorax sp. dw_308]